jgi:hypothetical protein
LFGEWANELLGSLQELTELIIRHPEPYLAYRKESHLFLSSVVVRTAGILEAREDFPAGSEC